MKIMIDCDRLMKNKVFRNDGNRKKRIKREKIRRKEYRCRENFHDMCVPVLMHACTTEASESGHITLQVCHHFQPGPRDE